MAVERGAVTQVTILNHVYHVRSDDPPEYVKELARYVDEKMKEISAGTTTVDSLKVAVLAALNIAHELHSARSELNDLESRVSHKSEEMLSLVSPLLDSRST